MSPRGWRRSIQILNVLVGQKLRTKQKSSTYESGVPLIDASHKRISIQFFVIAMVFILFDVEIAFIYPWALVFRSDGWPLFVEMLVFLAGPGGRVRLHLEEGSVRLVSHTRYRVEAAGEPRPFPPEAMARIEKHPEALPDEAGGAPARPLGRAGDVGLDLEGVGRRGRAHPGSARPRTSTAS